jgi:hypothetical protein
MIFRIAYRQRFKFPDPMANLVAPLKKPDNANNGQPRSSLGKIL